MAMSDLDRLRIRIILMETEQKNNHRAKQHFPCFKIVYFIRELMSAWVIYFKLLQVYM